MAVVEADRPELFTREVLESPVPVIVDFWAPWCGPCRMVAPELDALAKEYGGRVKVVKVNVDENQEAARAYGVMSIPMIGLFSKGQLVAKTVGAKPRHAIASDLKLAFFAPAKAPATDEGRPGAAPSRPDGRY
jgi:thioredoxin 1